jgi:FKBP-type peptidyl-prolyl cis-trans isomerase FklB
MKKIYVAAILSIAAIGMLFTSCGETVSTNPTLKSDKDTLSYALGISLYENMRLEMGLQQMGLIGDTMRVAMEYSGKINAEADSVKKIALRKEMKSKIDSINSANQRNLAEFAKGVQEGISAPKSKDAYLQGLSLGQYLSSNAIENVNGQLFDKDSKESLDKSLVVSGLVTAMTHKKPVIENANVLLDTKMKAIQEAKLEKEYGEQKVANQKFLDENKQKEGIVTLPSGVQYKVEKEGNGAKPTAKDVVKVHYHGTLIDGSVFDSSVERGQPATFGVGQVIPGWTEILQLMPVGSKWTVYIPYEQAYGAQGNGRIQPFSTLIFEVELLDIEKQ